MNKKDLLINNLEYHHFLLNYLINEKLEELIDIRESTVKKSIFFPIHLYNFKSPLNTLEGIILVKNIQSILLSKIKEIIGKKSIYYWFHLFRRFIPGSYFKNISPVTISLYSQMAECAFLKFGNLEIGDELVYLNGKDKNGINKIGNGKYIKALKEIGLEKLLLKCPTPSGIYLGNFGYQELIEFFQIEGLILEYWYTTSCLRRLYKGGKLIINHYNYIAENSSYTEELIKSFDKRTYKYGGSATSSGILIDDFSLKENKGIGLIPICNYEYLDSDKYPFIKLYYKLLGLKIVNFKEKFTPNFILQPFDFEEYYKKHDFCSAIFKKTFGYSFPCFISTIYLIFHYAFFQLIKFDIMLGHQYIQRAYSYISSIDDLIADLFELSKNYRIPSLQNIKLSKQEIASVVRELSFTSEKRKNINLTTRGPRFLTFPGRNRHLVLDYASIFPILLTKLHFLKGNLSEKGPLFEKNIKDKFKNKGYNIWAYRKELKQGDGTKKEIDIAFYIKYVMFIIELKCITRSFDFEEGNIKALEFRREKLGNALHDIDDKADWLKKSKKGLNYKIPSSISVIVPVVISPFVEYIWTTDLNLWLTKDVPRICAYQEILDILDQKKYKEFSTRPFIRFI